MNHLRVLFFLLWCVTLLWVSLQELGVLPSAFLPATAEDRYVQDILCVVTAVGASYAACRLFVWKRIRASMENDDLHTRQIAHRRWGGVRLALLAVAILPSAFLHYASAYSQTSLYCLFIALTASILCWPKKDIPMHSENSSEVPAA